MANIPQRDPETAGGVAGHAAENDSISAPYADADRFGSTQKGETTPIPGPRNLVSDEVWGWNDTAGGANAPLAPEVPVTKGE